MAAVAVETLLSGKDSGYTYGFSTIERNVYVPSESITVKFSPYRLGYGNSRSQAAL